jgi:hypothetical protein
LGTWERNDNWPKRQLTNGQWYETIIGRKDRFPNGQLVEMTFGRIDNWHNGQLAEWTTGRNANWPNRKLGKAKIDRIVTKLGLGGPNLERKLNNTHNQVSNQYAHTQAVSICTIQIVLIQISNLQE